MANPTVLVTSRSFSTGLQDFRSQLESAGARVVTGPPDHSLDVLAPLLAEATAWVAGTGPISVEHLEAAPGLRIIARYGVGVDAVDLRAARRRGVLVTNTPGANSGAVADHAVALMLAALRKVAAGDRNVRAGIWRAERARELGELAVGIVGFGRIGRGVATRLAGFGSTVLAHDPWVAMDDLRSAGIEPAALPELAAVCDVVTLHAPGTRTLIDSRWLARARSGLVLVNTARACLVDEFALAEALSQGQIGCYAADTISAESGLGASPLLQEHLLDRTVFTPHAAAQTVEAVDAMGRGATQAVLAVLRNEHPDNLVEPPR